MAQKKKSAGVKISDEMTLLPPEKPKKQEKKFSAESEKKKKSKAGRPKIIKKAKDLELLIEKYFSSISFAEPVRDGYGAIRTDCDGEMIERTVYISPPDVVSLCLFLGISQSTWENYCDATKNPDFAPVCERARMRMEAYLREVLVTREKGSLQGVIFNLQNNYGWRDKKTVDLGEETRDALAEMSLSEKMALIADLKSGKLDIPDPLPDDEDEDVEE